MEEYHDKKTLLDSPPTITRRWKGRSATSIVFFTLLFAALVTVPILWYLYRFDFEHQVQDSDSIWNPGRFNYGPDDSAPYDYGSDESEYTGSEEEEEDDDYSWMKIVFKEKDDSHEKQDEVSGEFIKENIPADPNKQCDNIEDDFRFDCHPENGASKEKCEARGCCWALPKKEYKPKSPNSLGVPYCFYPTDYPSYYIVNETTNGTHQTYFLARNGSSYYPNDIQLLKFESVYESDRRIRIRIFDPVVERYEVPYPLKPPAKDILSTEPPFQVIVKNQPFSFEIKHKATNLTILGMAGGFIFTDQFIQLSGLYSSKYFYGLGERRDNFLKSTDWQQFTMHAVDQAPIDNANLYGSHPFLFTPSPTATISAGLLLYNSNSMDVILQPAAAATFRTTGGILDFLLITGHTPAEVIQVYQEAIGRPLMPPYWSLGFHLCRFGYKSTNDTRRVWKNNIDAGIPLDVQWNDIDYMDNRRDFTYDKKNYGDLSEFVDEIHKSGRRYILMMEPALDTPKNASSYPPYAEALKRGLLVNDTYGKPFIGKVWSRNGAAWLDYTNPAAVDFWTEHISKFHKEIPFDGVWIDMNEPSNMIDGSKTGCPDNSSYENPPYLPHIVGGKLSHKTLCMTARQHGGIHYNLHNLYGLSEAIATNIALKKAIPGKRPFIISRSSFPGHGYYANHWSGDVSSSWDDMRKSIPSILNFNLFGIPMIGADICGFNGNTTNTLCARWMELGAFYPFSRNHNSDDTIAQDPVSLGEEVVHSAKVALSYRYQLLPYLYTLFYRAHAFGETVARPLFFEFPKDAKTYPIENQFMWGPAIMFLPVLDEGVTELHSYLPAGRWYMVPEIAPIDSVGSIYNLSAPLGVVRMAVRGGYVIPFKPITNTTTESRKAWFGIMVNPDADGNAKGELYWDDGETLDAYEQGKYNLINFSAKPNLIQSNIVKLGLPEELTPLQRIGVTGATKAPENVTINGKPLEFVYNSTEKMWMASNFTASLAEPITITWR